VERLTALDLMSIWPEARGWSNDIGALALLDGAGLVGADGRLPVEALRDHIGRRLHLVPRFRQLLYRPPFGLGWPLWVDAASVDLAEHIDVLPLEGPAGESNLLLACEELRRRRLSFSRPLWRMTFLTGLPQGRIGLFIKVHHAIADGMSGIATLGAFLDTVPEPQTPDAPPWTPARMPNARELFDDNVRRGLAKVDRTLARLARPRATVAEIRRGLPAMAEAFTEGRTPRTTLNAHPIGWHRRFRIMRSDLCAVKGVAHAHQAKVNDVLMTALAAGLRALLVRRGERVDGLVLRAAVPVSLHAQRQGKPKGNLDGMMAVPLPIGEADDVRRLQLIAAETRNRRKKARPQGGTLFRNPTIQRALLGLMGRQRFMNTYAANVPGPALPLYLAGARLMELFPIVPISGNVSIGIGALSYAGQFNITAVADRDLVPDIDSFVDGMRRSLQVLEGAPTNRIRAGHRSRRRNPPHLSR
jgi:diacylglycerol O-acyltransferase